ncbi:Fungal Zn(2)-Cys(6) binuclear cluster domain-containing protein 19 [Elsinoe fawcettii]|nr:Fungal Zn(2)-Cys(6) binuclear cluster domain-containing protein 19 [Elsinoe fawcettii]
MADGQNYPSPDEIHAASNGPFYDRPQQPDQSGLQQDVQQEIPDDLQLRADLVRTLAPITAQQQDSHIDESLLAQFGQQLQQSGSGVDIHQGSPDEIGPDGTHRRKDTRVKTSKACDECRRKKIRCDAANDNGETCSNCKRTRTVCLFQRQQLKRGPSKGYIKELADRLKHLEQNTQRLASSQNDAPYNGPDRPITLSEGPGTPQPQTGLIPQTSPTAQMAGHKRPYEMVDQSPVDALQRERTHQFQSQELPSPYPQPSSGQNTPGRQQETPQPQANGRQLQPFFKYGADPPRRDTYSSSYDATVIDAPAISDWDDEVVDEYYRQIHQTFPLLPHSKNSLRMRLSACPPGLREAFVTVLGCMMRTFPSSSLRATQSYASNMKRAAELIAGYPFDNPASHTLGTNLVYLQTLLLMALESDNHGPANMKGQGGPSRAEWLGRAAGVAGQLEINLIRPRESFATEGDPDSEERLARRVWWVLFILDRWHASSTADLLKLPENSVVLLPEDQILLGESTYHLARLSFIIGHLASILTTTKTPETNVMAPSNPASHLLGLTLAGEIDRFRESVESVWGSLNLVHLSYHHSHLLIKRLNPTSEPTELIGHALKVATVLNQRQTPITPLNHHFAALSAMTLCELADVPRTRADATRGLEQLAEALGGGRGLAGHPSDSMGWDSAIRELVREKRERMVSETAPSGVGEINGVDTPGTGEGNVAAIAPEERGGRKRFDPTMLTMYGYLTALGQGKFMA